MNQKIFKTHLDKQLCEALFCNAKATVEVYVKAGHHGLISLSLCKDCVKKFEIEGRVGQVSRQPTTAPDDE